MSRNINGTYPNRGGAYRPPLLGNQVPETLFGRYGQKLLGIVLFIVDKGMGRKGGE